MSPQRFFYDHIVQGGGSWPSMERLSGLFHVPVRALRKIGRGSGTLVPENVVQAVFQACLKGKGQKAVDTAVCILPPLSLILGVPV